MLKTSNIKSNVDKTTSNAVSQNVHFLTLRHIFSHSTYSINSLYNIFFFQLYFVLVKLMFVMKHFFLSGTIAMINEKVFFIIQWQPLLGKQILPSQHNHKKWKGSLERWDVLLILLLELEISGVVIQWIHQNSKKWWHLRGIG